MVNTFKCSKNLDLEEYLSQKAIDSDERGNAKTHLLINNQLKTPEVVGYFTLTIKPILADGISKEMIKKIDGFSKDRKCVYFYLIGQLGFSDKYIGSNLGYLLLFTAINMIEESQKIIGGRYILVDAFNCEPVVEFYKRNGFTKLITSEDDSISIKMIYKI
ncbi:Phage protein [hydrothermal vent metagenome]|uniref:Phage protein n=1 Tax=hydrothermal vent metagenome TaxID=652676 RepID=A0A1W1D4K4_9ZZZZ